MWIILKRKDLRVVSGSFGMRPFAMWRSSLRRRISVEWKFAKEALHCEIGLCLGPLALTRDFNCILSTSERVGGSRLTHLDSPKFQSLVDDYALVDFGFVGQATTWCKGGDSRSYVAKRLDRAFVNISTCLQWPDAIVKHLSKLKSDHNLVLLSLVPPEIPNKRHRPFRFEAAWLLHADFPPFVDANWKGESDALDALNSLRPKLLRWNKTIFRNILGEEEAAP
ncbi:hypothetical protein V2J09_007957 [Rumex salicifolius]